MNVLYAVGTSEELAERARRLYGLTYEEVERLKRLALEETEAILKRRRRFDGL